MHSRGSRGGGGRIQAVQPGGLISLLAEKLNFASNYHWLAAIIQLYQVNFDDVQFFYPFRSYHILPPTHHYDIVKHALIAFSDVFGCEGLLEVLFQLLSLLDWWCQTFLLFGSFQLKPQSFKGIHKSIHIYYFTKAVCVTYMLYLSIDSCGSFETQFIAVHRVPLLLP